MTKKIMNIHMAGQTLRVKDGKGGMLDLRCDADGCVEVSDEMADKLANTPGWSAPGTRAPRKAPVRPAAAPVVAEAPSEEGESADDETSVAPYEEWDYKALKAEARDRQEADPMFQPPDSGKAEDIIKALEADDEKNG